MNNPKVFPLCVLCTLAIFLCSGVTIAAGKTAYVSDQLVITLRQGKSTKHKILKTLPTGTPMEILDSPADDPYLKVKLQGGEEGYVLAQYISFETPKSTVISRLEKQLAELQHKLAESEKDTSILSADFQDIRSAKVAEEKELELAVAELDRLKEKYNDLLEQSQQVISITRERDDLLSDRLNILSEAQQLREDNHVLRKAGMVKWFLAGAGVFLFGWITGKISRRKKQGLTL